MKQIIPKKLITTFDKDGQAQNSVLLYQIKTGGVLDNKFHTISVKAGVNIGNLNKILKASITHAEKGEHIKEAKDELGQDQADIE